MPSGSLSMASPSPDQAADSIAAYYADGNKQADHDVVLSPELGLALERLPEGIPAKSLWAMV